MRRVTGILSLLAVLAVMTPLCRAGRFEAQGSGAVRRGAEEEQDDKSRLADAAGMVQVALHRLGVESVSVIAFTAEDRIGGEEVLVFAAGSVSADEAKFTAEYHFAVSRSGQVYYMDPVAGAEWVPVELDGADAPGAGASRSKDSGISVNVAGAVKLLESLPPALTSLNRYNRPYEIKEYEDHTGQAAGLGGLLLEARNTETGRVFARFAVEKDLETVYRIDSDLEKPVLIYGEGGE